MSLTQDAQAIMLLTVHFPKSGSDSAKPLTTTEWARLNKWLLDKDADFRPSDLMTGRLSEWLEGWSDKRVKLERVEALLKRGLALALNMEKWERSGLWVMTRSDADYPERIKEKLGREKSPHILFGCGNKELLQGERKGLAVVGSRNAEEEDLEYSRRLGRLATNSGWSVISGSARGVDETAMLGALETGGTSVGVLANSLLQASRGRKYRSYLMDDSLVLVSPFNPEAGFNPGNAMARNKYIYCLSEAAVVVKSDTKGGTWEGAKENQKYRWVPLRVKKSEHEGNRRIVEMGARWLTNNLDEIDILNPDTTEEPKSAPMPPTTENVPIPESSYEFFLSKARLLCNDSPKNSEYLQRQLPYFRSEYVARWLQIAEKDGKVKKLQDSRYQWIDAQQDIQINHSDNLHMDTELPEHLENGEEGLPLFENAGILVEMSEAQPDPKIPS